MTSGSRQRRAAQVRDRIIDAAVASVSEVGYGSERVLSAVARHAGISRPTLYRYFAGFDPLWVAVIDREVAALVADVTAAIEGMRWDLDDVVEVVAGVVEHARAHSLLAVALRDRPGEVHAAFAGGAARWVGAANTALGPRLQARMASGELPVLDATTVVESLCRLALSMTFTTGVLPADSPEQLRSALRGIVGVLGSLATPGARS